MPGSATPASDAPSGRLQRLLRALRARSAASGPREVQLARILDLFEEHVYAGEITPDGRYVHHVSPISIANLIGDTWWT